MYGDTTTVAMKEAIDETNRRRSIQIAYNEKNGIVPKTVVKQVNEVIHGKQTQEMVSKYIKQRSKMAKQDQKKLMLDLEKEMNAAAAALDFERAAELRDMLFELKEEIN